MRVRRSVAAVALALALTGAGACSKPAVSADDATSTWQRTLQATQAQADCMHDKFGDGDVAAVMDTEKAPTDEQRSAFLAAIRSCVPVPDFAALLAASFDQSVDDAGAGQSECVRTTVIGLSSQEQDQLYLFFSNPTSLDPDAVAATSTKLSDACGLSGPGTIVGPVQTTPS